MKRNLLTLIACLFYSYSWAQETIVTDRPDQTESSQTIPHKSFQIESGFGFTFANAQTSISSPNTLLRYGLFPFLELRLFNDLLIQKNLSSPNISGLSDLQFGIKLQLYKKENKNTTVGFLSHVIAPSGSRALSENVWGSMSRFLVTHQINDRTALAYNLGYAYHNSTKGDLIYTLSCAHSISEKFGVFAEVYGDWTEFESANLNGDAGFTYLFKPNLQFDLSYGLGFTERMNFLSTGICWNIAPSPRKVSPTNN